jgi:hypothetical protein
MNNNELVLEEVETAVRLLEETDAVVDVDPPPPPPVNPLNVRSGLL